MENSQQTTVASFSTNTIDELSHEWKTFWLLSYILPYLVLLVILLVFGDVESSGYLAAFVIFGPFILGLVGTICSLALSRLPLWQSALLFLLTIIGYVIGLALFAFAIALTFGVIAT